MILAYAVAASASHVVTRDDELLSLGTYQGVTLITPEAFLTMLRCTESWEDAGMVLRHAHMPAMSSLSCSPPLSRWLP